MDFSTPLADATTPVADANAQSPAVAQNGVVGQSLGGEYQAPSPTEGASQSGTPEPTGEQTPQTVAFEEYQRVLSELESLKPEYQSTKELLDGIKQIAEQQQQEEKDREFRQSVRGELANVFRKAVDAGSEDEALELLANFHFKGLDTLTENYQGTLSDYEQRVQETFWQATAPGFADQLMKDMELPGTYRESLLAANGEKDMIATAQRLKNEYAAVRAQIGQQFADRSVQQIRDSGANRMSAENGNVPQPQIKPGTKEELMPVLRSFLYPSG